MIDPPLDPDPLGAALIKSLTRFIGRGLSWPAWLTFIVGLPTLGIVPLVWQTRRFLHHSAVERTQWRHVAEWVESATGRSMQRLLDVTEQQRPSIGYVVAIALMLLAAAVSVGIVIANGSLLTISGWFARRQDATWGIIFTAAMSIGYAVYYVLVCRGISRNRAIVEVFNDLAVDAIEPPADDLGFHGAWLGGAALFALLGLPWGVLMMLAGGAQRRYTTLASVRVRAAVVERLQQIRNESSVGQV